MTDRGISGVGLFSAEKRNMYVNWLQIVSTDTAPKVFIWISRKGKHCIIVGNTVRRVNNDISRLKRIPGWNFFRIN